MNPDAAVDAVISSGPLGAMALILLSFNLWLVKESNKRSDFHMKQVERMNASHMAQIADLNRDHDAAIDKLNESHLKQISKMIDQISRTVDQAAAERKQMSVVLTDVTQALHSLSRSMTCSASRGRHSEREVPISMI